MKTIDGVLAEVRHQKTCSKVQLRRYLTALDIKPLGVRQRPQQYADDTAARILAHLGIVEQTLAAPVKVVRPVTMNELRRVRSAAAATRRKAA